MRTLKEITEREIMYACVANIGFIGAYTDNFNYGAIYL